MISIKELYQHYLQYPSICTDTRQIKEGDLFFALKGDNFNGNLYAHQALEKGAAFAIVDEVEIVQSDKYLLVENVLVCLQELASWHRSQIDIPVIAISGSNGKTTTKELLAGVLGSHFNTHFTKGNLNNHIGVPLTLLSMSKDTEVAVIEMGANHIGEIADLCEIAKPTHGLLTNVGQAHIEGFGSFEGVKKAKSELYDYLAKNEGIVFVNLDEQYLYNLSNQVSQKVRYSTQNVSQGITADIVIECLNVQPSVRVAYKNNSGVSHDLTTKLSGQHNLQNIITAITVGQFFKVPTDKMSGFLATYQPKNNRSQWMEKEGVQFLLDAYNANPSSMKASLLNFSQQGTGRKLAILGDMLELGDSAKAHHLEIAEYALSLGIDNVYLVGQLFKDIANQLKVSHFDNVELLKSQFDFQEWVGSKVLIKGSRGIALERLLN